MIQQVIPGGFVVFSAEDSNARNLIGIREDIHFVGVSQYGYTHGGFVYNFPEIQMKIPGEHILLDAKLAYVVAHMIGISQETILSTLENYT